MVVLLCESVVSDVSSLLASSFDNKAANIDGKDWLVVAASSAVFEVEFSPANGTAESNEFIVPCVDVSMAITSPYPQACHCFVKVLQSY